LKNILFLHTGAELYGADLILLELLRGLDKSIYTPFVILPNEGPLANEIRKLDIKLYIYNYPILRRQYFTPFGILKYFIETIKSITYLLKFMKSNNIDIIHSNTLAVLEGGILHSLTKKMHIWHVHEIIKEPKFLRSFYKKFVPKMSSKVLCVSNAVKDNIISNNINPHNAKGVNTSHIRNINIKDSVAGNVDKIIVIHNGVNTDKFTLKKDFTLRQELSIPKDEILIGMVGRVNKIKGQSFFIDVAKRLLQDYNNVSFVLVGDAFKGKEYLMEDLLKESKDPLLKGKLHIKGFTRDTVSVYNNLDIFVLPSIKPDSLPTVVLEAMSCSLPIVANVTGGVSEMVEDNKNGFLIYNIDVNTMVEKLRSLIENKGLRDSFGKRSRAIIEEDFAVSTFHKKINEIYL